MIKFEKPWIIQQTNGKEITIRFNPNDLKLLGKIYFLDLPNVGAELKEGMPSIGIEAHNWIGISKVPVNGKVSAINQQIAGLNAPKIHENSWVMKLIQ